MHTNIKVFRYFEKRQSVQTAFKVVKSFIQLSKTPKTFVTFQRSVKPHFACDFPGVQRCEHVQSFKSPSTFLIFLQLLFPTWTTEPHRSPLCWLQLEALCFQTRGGSGIKLWTTTGADKSRHFGSLSITTQSFLHTGKCSYTPVNVICCSLILDL